LQEGKADPWTLIKKNLIDVDPSSSTCAPLINWSIREMALQIVGIRTAADPGKITPPWRAISCRSLSAWRI